MKIINILEILSFLTGLVLITRINARFLFFVLAIVGYSSVNEIIAFLYSYHFHRTNILFYVIYSFISFILFFIALRLASRNKSYHRIVDFSIGIFSIIAWLEIIFKSGFYKYPFSAMAFGCVTIVIFCFKGLVEILNDEKIRELKFESKFWFLSGTLFFHFLLLTYIFVHDYVKIAEIQLFNKYFITAANFIFYPFMIIAFLCQLKKTN